MVHEPFLVWVWAAEGKDSWGKFGQEASEMGLERGLQKILFCDDQGLQELNLQLVGAALKDGEKTPKSVTRPKCLRGTPHGGAPVHVLVLASSAKGVVKVNV